MHNPRLGCLLALMVLLAGASLETHAQRPPPDNWSLSMNHNDNSAVDFFEGEYYGIFKRPDNELTKREKAYAVAQQIAYTLRTEYPDWFRYLPFCPLTTELIDEQRWESDNMGASDYHPGASCFRSVESCKSPRAPKRHRQQCCYSSGGVLITSGDAAGTPDFASEIIWLPGEESGYGHLTYDVFTWHLLPLDEYHQTWPPALGEIPIPKGQLTRSGLSVEADQCYLFEAHGEVTFKIDPATGQKITSGPEGTGLRAGSLLGLLFAPPPVANASMGTLLMKVLAPDGETVDGPYWIGKRDAFIFPYRGELFFYSNDVYTDDNEGAFYVSVRRCML